MTTDAPTPPSPSPGRGRPPFFSLTFLLLLFGGLLAIVIYQRINGLNPGGLTPADHRSPYALDLATLDGPRWKLADHAGHVVVLNYFATWCGPCQEEFPDLNKIAGDYAARSVDVAAVGLDADSDSSIGAVASLRNFVKSENAVFPILLPDASTHTNEMIPYTYLIDRHGRVAYFMLGRFETAHLRSLIDRLLQEP
jgi:thiol-disulfide isomerase/thioredoxin